MNSSLTDLKEIRKFGVIGCIFFGTLLAAAGWLKIAHFIGSKVTILILTIMFYFVITPAALLKRIFGGRPLPVKPDPDAETYWVTRPEPTQPKERFPKRY